MRRARKAKNQYEVSLFPFLAVMICTVGVLIVMLMINVKSADVRAKQEQSNLDEERQAVIDQLQDELDEQLIQMEGLQAVRPDALERLSRSRQTRSYMTRELREIESQLAALHASRDQLAVQAKMPSADAEQKIAELQEKIEIEIERRSVAKASYVENPPTVYSIVPHKGAGGTNRRPIFIECTRDKIVIQPHGIEIVASDFLKPVQAENPLDAALIAVREYWVRYGLAGTQGDPYPLIVVRPDGAQTYVMARHAIKSWDDEFGYELIDAEKTLDFGTRDIQLEEEIARAVQLARERLRKLMAAQVMVRGNQMAFQRTPRPGMRASSAMGGFVNEGGDNGTGDSVEKQREWSAGGDGENESAQKENEFAGDDSTSQKFKQSAGGQKIDGVEIQSRELSLANERGGDWALPTSTQGATGYRRPVRIYCWDSHVSLQSVNGQWQTIEMPGSTREAVEPIVESIWQLIESWGSAGSSGYWKPELRVSVMPGGETRYADLVALLDNSGLEIQFSPGAKK